MSDPVEMTHGEIAQLIRVAGQIGTYLAQNQQVRLREAQRASELQRVALSAQLKDELLLGKRFYAQVERDEWWDRATPHDIAHAYGFARRFSALDPEAVTAASVIEQETLTRYGVELRSTDPREFSDMANQDVVAPFLATDTRSQTEVDNLINAARQASMTSLRSRSSALGEDSELDAARHNEAREQEEAQVVHAKPDEYSPDRVKMEHQEAVDAKAYVDTLEQRQQWAQAQQRSGVSMEAVQAIGTASKARSQPLSAAIFASGTKSSSLPHASLQKKQKAAVRRSR